MDFSFFSCNNISTSTSSTSPKTNFQFSIFNFQFSMKVESFSITKKFSEICEISLVIDHFHGPISINASHHNSLYTTEILSAIVLLTLASIRKFCHRYVHIKIHKIKQVRYKDYPTAINVRRVDFYKHIYIIKS